MAIVSNSARTIRNKSFADGLLPQYQETLLAPNLSSIQYLAIAGGGAGGVTLGGGGGAGGFIEAYLPNNISAANLTLSIIIGAGAAGTGVASTQGANGGNTIIYSPVGLTPNVIAVGGGGGGYYSAGVQTNGSNGGSGGGAGSGGSGQSRSGGGGYGYPSPTQQGNPGGNNFALDGSGASGGGGGAGAVGGGGAPPGLAGSGGAGKVSSILGYPVIYAGGGGGSGTTGGGAGFGSGYEGTWSGTGNGTPSSSPVVAGSGTSNSGGGGGGGNATPLGNSGSGGSGVVILRYPDTFANAAVVTGNPNVYYQQQNIIYRFYQSGSITFADVPRYLL